MESKPMQTCNIIWTYLATKQEFFFANLAPVQNMTDIVLLVFLFLFVKNILFSNVYISVNMIFECYLFFVWEICHPLSTCGTQGMEVVIQNEYRCIQEERGITPHVKLQTCRELLISCFCLKVSCPSVLI